MKRMLGICFCFFLSACIQPSPKTQNRNISSLPRHVIIAVHGIGGDATTWGDLGRVLPLHLSAINPNFQHEFYNFTYPTGHTGLTTFQVGEDNLNRFLEDVVFRDHPLQPEDRISFVAHSQGGLVVSIWYTDTLVAAALKQEGRYRKDISRFAKYANQVDSIVTLGTPFWGSKLATRFADPMKFDPTKPIHLFNPDEMDEMAFSSNTIYQFRRTTIALSQRPELKSSFKARMLNISGVFPKDDNRLYYPHVQKDRSYKISKAVLDFIREKFFAIGFGSERYESDVAVLVPSSRMKFLYADNLSAKGSQTEISGNDFREADFFSANDWIVTESIHSPILPAYNFGMAYIPAYCEKLSDCKHPTYPYILKALANCEANSCDTQATRDAFSTLNESNAGDDQSNQKLAESLTGFDLEIVLRMPSVDYDIEDPRFKTKPGVRFYTQKVMSIEDDRNDHWLFSQEKFFDDCVKMFRNKEGQVQVGSDLVDVHLAPTKEYLSKIVSWREIQYGGTAHKDLRLHLTGNIRPTAKGLAQAQSYQALIQKGVDLPFEFDLPGIEKQKVTVRVSPAYSSYLELQLRPQTLAATAAKKSP